MNKLLTIVFILTSFGLHAQGFRQISPPDSSSVYQQINQMNELLNLTTEQQNKLFTVLWQNQQKLFQHFNSGQDFRQIRGEIRALRQQSIKAMREILNEEQLNTYLQMISRRQNSRQQQGQNDAPNHRLKGMVKDATDSISMAGAYVTATHLRDSIEYKTVTNQQGSFILELKPGRYSIKITFLGYENYQQPTAVFRQPVDLGVILLQPGTSLLDELEIRGQVPQSEQRGDTTVFNSQAFKTNPDANAEDLIKKLPGVTVSNGSIQAQGENVREVLVDGRQFFSQDPNLALRNLPAEVIDKIEIFDRQSEQAQLTGFDDGQTIKTINIVTKPATRDGVFGKAYGGIGSDNTYKIGGNINLFEKDTRLTLVGQSNNINQQNFSNEDLLGVVSTRSNRRGFGRGGGRPGGGMSGNRGGRLGNDISNFMVGQQNGISSTNAFGLNYSDRWGDKMEINGSYFYNASENITRQSTKQEFFLANSENQLYHEEIKSSNENFNHRLNLRLQYKIDSANEIRLIPSLSFQENLTNSLLTGIARQEEELLSQTMNDFQSNNFGYNFNTRLLYSHRFAKRGRTFTANINLSANENNADAILLAENLLYKQQNFSSDSLDQLSEQRKSGYGWGADFRYTEPVGSKGLLMGSYEYNSRNSENDKLTNDFDEFSSGYNLIDSSLSNHFASNFIRQSTGMSYRFRGRNISFFIGLNYQWATLSNSQFFPASNEQEFNFQNLIPMVIMRYDLGNNKNLRIFYRPRTNEPSIVQLQNVVDNTNPLQISMGNPNLNQEYTHNLFIRYAESNPDRASTFFAMIGGSVTQDYITNTTLIAQKDTLIFNDFLLTRGSQFSQPVNLDGYWNLRSFITYGLPFSPIKSNLNFNLSASYTATPGIVNENKNLAKATLLGWGVVISSNISEKVDFNISSQSNYNIVISSLQQQNNNNYFIQSTALDLNLIFPWGIVLRSNLNHQFFRGLSEGFDQDFLLWNMSLGKKFFKNERGELALTVFDLLNQNTSINRQITDAYLEDVRTNVLQQYIMLTFTYQIRNFRENE